MTDDREAGIARGREIRATVLGAENVAKGRQSDSLVADLGNISEDALWGRIWGRPGLDLKWRSMCTFIALLTLERYDYARIHIGGAKNLGLTRTEVAEAVMQLTFYAGLPVVHEGLKLVAEVYGTDAK